MVSFITYLALLAILKTHIHCEISIHCTVRLLKKAQKKAQFSFCEQRKAFHYEIVVRGIQPYFLHGGERLACFEMQPRQRRFGKF